MGRENRAGTIPALDSYTKIPHPSLLGKRVFVIGYTHDKKREIMVF